MLYVYFHRMKGNAGNLYETELTWPEKVFIIRLPIWFVQPCKWMNDGLAEKKKTRHLLLLESYRCHYITSVPCLLLFLIHFLHKFTENTIPHHQKNLKQEKNNQLNNQPIFFKVTQLWLPHSSLKGSIPCKNVDFAVKV